MVAEAAEMNRVQEAMYQRQRPVNLLGKAVDDEDYDTAWSFGVYYSLTCINKRSEDGIKVKINNEFELAWYSSWFQDEVVMRSKTQTAILL